MGLDMYLYAKKYVGDWDHSKEEEKAQYRAILKAVGLPETFQAEGSPHLEVEVCVCYWRKANQIHNWFVQNVQEGEDDCQESYVSREQLVQLRDLCREVLCGTALVKGAVHNGTTYEAGGKVTENWEEGEVIVDPSTAKKLLPSTSGFFFGSTDYDQWYAQDIKHTETTLTAILENPIFSDQSWVGWSFYYRASW